MTAANPNIDDLLRHQDWVRALARSLVADPARAEDVAQQTMLEAITKAPRDLQRPKGWLAQVARNAARAFARSDRRRQSREQVVAKSDVVLADPADAAHRAAAHKRLVDAVFELPEPYHTVVLLRYFEDLEPQQIATQLHRPVSTVRTQLQRGLAAMRDKLDRRFGDRSAWHAAVLPLFAPKQVAAGVPILTAFGSLAMWKIVMPVVALLAAFFVGLKTMWADSPPVPRGGGSGAVEVAVANERYRAESPDPGREVVSVAPQAVIPIAPTEERFHARVVSPDGAPLAGLTIAYHDHRLPRLVGQTLIMGQDRQRIDQPGLRDLLGTPHGIAAFASSYGDHAEVVEALLSGKEVDRPRALTDGLGRFSFNDPEVADNLYVERDGVMIYGEGRLPGDQQIVYIVGPSVDVRGHIVDENGNALADAYVSMSMSVGSLPGFGQGLQDGSFRSWNVTSASDGSFSLGTVPQHSALHVSVSKRDYQSRATITADIRGAVRWPLKAKPKSERKVLSGMVRLADGRPAKGANVLFGSYRGKSNDSGQFEFSWGYNSPATSLVAYLPGLQPAVRARFAEQLKINSTLQRGIVLQLGEKTLSISGRVLDARGEPLEDVTVLLGDGVSASSNQWLESVLAEQSHKGERTDRSGSFTLKGLSARTYNVRAIDEANSVVLESGPIQAGSSDVVLRTPKDATRRLEGVVVDGHAQPIQGVTVQIMTPRMAMESGTYWHDLGEKLVTGVDGRFVFPVCPRRHATLWIDGAPVDWQTIPVPSDNQPMRVVVHRLLKFSVRITSNLGADHFAVLDQEGTRIQSTCHMVTVTRSLKSHPIVVDDAPFYQTDDRATHLLLLKQGKEVGRVPLNLRPDQQNIVDI